MKSDFSLPAKFSLDVPNFGDYFGLWNIHVDTFNGIVNRYQGLNIHAHINSCTASDRIAAQNQTDYPVTKEGIALFQVSGVMMKSVGSMSDGTSTVRMRQKLRGARRNSDVKGGLLIMDTPGGTVRGNQDFADAVAAFEKVKPLYVFVEDMAASAGVSVASQGEKRFANNPSALYGAMGTYAVLEDASGMAEQLGIKVHVIKAGEHKGAGTPGTEITAAQLEEVQRIVNALNDNYLELIARGLNRSVDSIRAIADGRVHTAADAVKLGLIDGIQTADETYSQLVAATKRRSTVSMRTSKMENENSATLAELKASFPKSTAEWRETQLEAGASLQDAAIAYAAHIEEKAEAERKEHAKQLEEAKAARTQGSQSLREAAGRFANALGHEPVRGAGKNRTAQSADGDEDGDDRQEYIESGDAIEDFNAAVAKFAGQRPDLARRQRAIQTVANRDPELYEAYLLATNPGKRQTRLITEKMESVFSK